MVHVHVSKALDEVCVEVSRTADLTVASVKSIGPREWAWYAGTLRILPDREQRKKRKTIATWKADMTHLESGQL